MKIKYAIATLALSTLALTSCTNKQTEINQVYQPTSMIVYEANPQFFASDSCFDAIANRLSDIKDMGANVLWLMPIFEPGVEKSVGSPYCVKNYQGINSKYGDMASLKALVSKSHENDIIVILDWVANHTAWDNAWVTEHPDWFTEERNDTEKPWLDVAILNYDNPDVATAMADAMVWWVKETGIDGFRCDYTEGVPEEFWKMAIDSIRAINPSAFMLAEGSRFSLYEAGFDMIYDWQYCLDLQDFYHGKIDFAKLVELTETRAKEIPQGKQIMRYVINHDVIAEHSPAELYGANEAVPGAYVLTAFLGQVPLVYSGMEAGFDQRTSFFHGIAKPMVWNESILDEYERIDKAYKMTEEARTGELSVFDTQSAAVAYAHNNGTNAVLVLVNPTKDAVKAMAPTPYVGSQMSDMISGESLEIGEYFDLAPYQYNIFVK